MGLMNYIRGLFAEASKEVHPEIAHAQEDLQQLDALAAQEQKVRERMTARLAALSADLDNLVRREGISIDRH